MVTYRNSQKISFSRWIDKQSNDTVLAFQFPEEGLDHIRRLWRSPKANAGDWFVKTGIGTILPHTKVTTNENFTQRYRRPHHGQKPATLSEEPWNTR